MRLLLIALAFVAFTACELRLDSPPHNYGNYSHSTYSYDYGVCYEEPPYYSVADYCDEYVEGYCCEWYSYSTNWDACYEEWCVWDDVCGWEYYAENCYAY